MNYKNIPFIIWRHFKIRVGGKSSADEFVEELGIIP